MNDCKDKLGAPTGETIFKLEVSTALDTASEEEEFTAELIVLELTEEAEVLLHPNKPTSEKQVNTGVKILILFIFIFFFLKDFFN
jgi:hypothetical protein